MAMVMTAVDPFSEYIFAYDSWSQGTASTQTKSLPAGRPFFLALCVRLGLDSPNRQLLPNNQEVNQHNNDKSEQGRFQGVNHFLTPIPNLDLPIPLSELRLYTTLQNLCQIGHVSDWADFLHPVGQHHSSVLRFLGLFRIRKIEEALQIVKEPPNLRGHDLVANLATYLSRRDQACLA
jgi:hypothetical protein